LKDKVSLEDQLKEAYVNYHSPWIIDSEKEYWWNKIKQLNKQRASES
jgi:hypothetical protein